MSAALALFKQIFNSIKHSENRYQVFADFTHLASLSIENVFVRSVKLEDQYRDLMNKYHRDDQVKLSRLLAITVEALEDQIQDFLGQAFMSLELSSSQMGQFFTPDPLSMLCANLTLADAPERLKRQRYVTIQEPAAGAGGMLLQALQTLRNLGVDTDHQAIFECRELHEVASNMCYIQMSLAGAAAVVITCNTLTGVEYRRRYTPVFYLCNWQHRLTLPRDYEPEKPYTKIIRRTRNRQSIAAAQGCGVSAGGEAQQWAG